ncbi:glutamate synthase subunit beta [Clostridium sp. AL.422]|uniref:glutamate synthase subunit beta n=1 Tax=Clostridium TaxID=1485 RepID=UPI00293DF8A7|nr:MULTISPECIES: glutamate synthase subunit beta [unclassified Clostridium]MDV4151772.1 glutamate synthase subunit beta [Clostridium sp. AL.422]
MGKPTGFLEFERKVGKNDSVEERITHYNEFHHLLSKDEQIKQGARCMNCGIPYCQSGIIIKGMSSGCPLNNLIPEFNDLIYKDNIDIALDRLLKTNPFPEFTGRVCPAPCEPACTVSINGPAVSIKENERYIIDTAFNEGIIKAEVPKYRNNKRVAIIGSGPAGLSCSYYLNRFGYNVDVFEREDRLGGLLMYGIPNMKLDKEVVNRRIELLQDEGVRFFTKSDICLDENLKNKVLEEYDAIVLATGATKPRNLNVPGRELKGIHFAVDYLKENTRNLLNNISNDNYISCKDKNVLIIGGGDTGTDCVGTSIRQGCKSVIQLEITNQLPKKRLESNPWPEWRRTLKVDYGQEEAIEIFGEDPRRYSTSVKEFISDDSGSVKAAKTIRVNWYEDESGRLTFKEVEGSEEIIDVDIVMIAMGFLGTEEYISNSFDVNLDNRGNINAEYKSFKTNKEKIFTCGDARRGQSLVVWAIREGLEAAKSINDYLTVK